MRRMFAYWIDVGLHRLQLEVDLPDATLSEGDSFAAPSGHSSDKVAAYRTSRVHDRLEIMHASFNQGAWRICEVCCAHYNSKQMGGSLCLQPFPESKTGHPEASCLLQQLPLPTAAGSNLHLHF